MVAPLCMLLMAAIVPAVLAAAPRLTPQKIVVHARADEENWRLVKYTGYTWACCVAVILTYHWTITLLHHFRRIANLSQGASSHGRQRYFAIPDERWAWIKRYLTVAPFWKKRHHREFKLSAAVDVGTLPSRIQTLALLGYLALNFATGMVTIDWSNREEFYIQARKRAGMLSTLNMIPLFLLAGRNNPLIWLLGISFDTMNLLHRWIGRIVVAEAVAHGTFWVVEKIDRMGAEKGWAAIWSSIAQSDFILAGTVAGGLFVLLLLHSPSIIRHAFYETFLHVHQILILTSAAGLWIHLKLLDSSAWLSILIAALAIWLVERTFRVYLIIRNNFGNGVTKAEIEALPGDAVRITLRVARPWKYHPGQHVYMYMPSVGLWTSHPFTLAWSEEADGVTGEKVLPVAERDVFTSKTVNMSLLVRRRTGFTDKLYRKAEQAPGGKFISKALVEGPYGNQSFQSYGTVMLFAAGVGVSHQVPHVRDLVAAYGNGTCATRKVVLVWIIPSPEHLEWIRPWMTQILGMEKRRDVLKILLFITRPKSTKEVHSPSSSVQMFPGKPDVGALIDAEQSRQIGAMAISTCGTGSLSDDLREAMRQRCTKTAIDFFEEAFSW